jgi:hypothetical protein
MFEGFRATQRYQELIRCWIAYRDMIQRFEGAQGVTEDHESRFLRLKAKIAGLLPILESRAPGSLARETQRRVVLMTELLNRHRTLRREEPPTESEQEEFQRGWHEHYIFLNQLKGVPVVREPKASPRRPGEAPTGMPARKLRRGTPGGWFLRFVLRVAVLAVAIYVIGRAFGFRWGVGGGLEFERPRTISGLGTNLWQAIQSFGSGIIDFMQPVVYSYGLESTIALVGVLLIALGYMFFIRR